MKYSNELKVGAALVAAVLIFIFGIRFFKDVPLLSGSYELRTQMVDAKGLISGNPVRTNGVKIGSVKSVSFDQQAGLVRVVMGINKGVTVPEGTTCEVTGIDALTGIRMEMNLGPLSNPPIPAGGSIPTIEEGGDLLADIYYELGDTGSAAAIRPRWQELAVDDDQQIRVELNAAVNAFWKEGDADAATAALDRADAHPPSVWRDEAEAVRSVFLASQGRAAEAVEIAEPLIERDPDRVLIQAAMALTHAYRTQGRVEDAVAICDRALAAYAELGEQIALISMRVLGVGRTIALAETGRLEDADSDAARILQLCRTEGEVGGIGLAALVQGWVHFTRGRIRSARQALRLAEDSFARTGHAGMRQWAHIALALVCATSGDRPGAQGWLDVIDRDGLQPAAMFSAALARARAWTAWGAGDPESARDLLISGSEDARRTGDAQGELACLHDLARLGGATTALDRWAGSEPNVQGALNSALADHISAMASGRAVDLGDAAESMVDLGAWLWAAEAAYGAADAARREGDPRMAAHWSRRATEWRAACETAATPGLVADLAPVPLTRREREVAILAADGLAAREIGERLYVSRRTVESHLARVYAKLGIGSRAELASLLQDPPR